MCTCLRNLTASICTSTICARSSDSGTVSCTDPIGGKSFVQDGAGPTGGNSRSSRTVRAQQGEAVVRAGRSGPNRGKQSFEQDGAAPHSSTSLERLCQHSGRRLTGCRVRATDRATVRTSCANGEGADGSCKRLQARAQFFSAH